MRVPHAFLLAAADGGLLAAAASCHWNERALFVHVHAEQDSLSQCFIVVATDDDGGRGQSQPHAVSAGQTLSAGVYQGALGERVMLEAQGFTSPSCADSGTVTGPFPYAPSNFSPGAIAVPDAGLIINCDAGYDTGTRTGFLCGAGRIRLNAALGCSFESGPDQVLSPPATSNQRGDAGCP